jgi:hypothetical protein
VRLQLVGSYDGADGLRIPDFPELRIEGRRHRVVIPRRVGQVEPRGSFGLFLGLDSYKHRAWHPCTPIARTTPRSGTLGTSSWFRYLGHLTCGAETASTTFERPQYL